MATLLTCHVPRAPHRRPRLQLIHVHKRNQTKNKAIDSPPELSVKNAVQLLQSLGALDDQEELTDLGSRLAGISIDPRCALSNDVGGISRGGPESVQRF